MGGDGRSVPAIKDVNNSMDTGYILNAIWHELKGLREDIKSLKEGIATPGTEMQKLKEAALRNWQQSDGGGNG